jgi:hypothetical protein
LLAEEITEKDLIPEGGVKSQEEDKRGEVLYNVPDLMQINHEQKCSVRIAFELDLLKRDWEESPEDVIKSIRVSEIMAVVLLNVDETDPPFAIRSFSETVQFVDKDDYTEWIFYVKPVKLGRFPLLLRVSVIEMINNKEYKKDIVLEEEITVQTEEVPEPGEAEFKSAGTSIMLGNTPLAPAETEAPAAQVKEAGKKGLQRVAGALLTAAALAASGYFGFKYYEQERDWDKAGEGGNKSDYQEYLEDYPDGRHSEEARRILDSLSAPIDTMPVSTNLEEPGATGIIPADSSSESIAAATQAEENKTAISPSGKKPIVSGQKKKKTSKSNQNTVPQQQKKPPGAVTSADTVKQLPPPPVPAGSLLRGNQFYFKIPRFNVIESEEENLFFTFYQFNEYREVLAVFGSLGEAKMIPGTKISLVPDKGGELTSEVKYVATTPQIENRSDWYVTFDADELARLANEKFKAIRLLNASGQVTKTYKFTGKGSKNLNRRAGEALKKLDNK